MTINFKTIKTNNIWLHTALAGPEDGEPVFLLHGFPDAWFGWEAQIEALAKAGYRVIAPDQRGYNLSDKPKGVKNYQMKILVEDIIGLADSLGYARFNLAGHDFGAMVSWGLAMRYPERLKKLIIANVPHPSVMNLYLRSHPAQMLKSWYAFFFQMPVLPESMVRLGNWCFLMNALPKYLSASEKARYRKAWGQPGAMKGMINWYRASFRGSGKTSPVKKIQTPTLILWGKQDPHLSYEMAQLSAARCENVRMIPYESASHWVLQDKAEEVSKEMIEHLKQ